MTVRPHLQPALSIAFACTLALACGGPASRRPQAVASEEITVAPALEENPYRSRPDAGRIIVGEWTEERAGEGDWVAGLAVVDAQLAALVRRDGDSQLVLRGPSGWAASSRHSHYDRPVELVVRDGEIAVATGGLGEVLVLHVATLDGTGRSHSGPCVRQSAARALAGPSELWLVQSCRAEAGVEARVEVSRRLGESWERIPLDGVDVHSDLEAALDGDGAAHVLAYGQGEGDYRGSLGHFVVEQGAARAVPFPGEPPESGVLAACGGRVHAALSADSRVALAVWDGARWLFGRDELAPRGRIEQLVFDEACRPFLLTSSLRDEDNAVFSYGRAGWIPTRLPEHDGMRKRAVIFEGSVHVAYTAREGREQLVSIASAPLGEER